NRLPPGRATRSRIEPRLMPGRLERFASELHPVMQPEWPVLPELDQEGPEAVAGPIRRSWNRPNGTFRRVKRDGLLKRVRALERRRLLACRGADLGEARAGRKIGIRFRIFDPFHGAAQSHLPVERLPMKKKRAFVVAIQFPALLAVDIGIEYEAALTEALHKHHA